MLLTKNGNSNSGDLKRLKTRENDGVKLKKRPVTIGGTPRVEVEPTGIKLRRNLGLISGTSVIVGTIIGSGIFISPKGVLQETGSVGLSLVVWAAGGMLSLMGALSYAELGTLISKSGAEYHYLMAALGRVVAFLFAWTKVIILTPSSLAIICLTFAEYVMSLMEFCGEPQIPKKMIAALAIITLAIVNSLDTTLAASVQVFFTGAKLIALVIIVTGGLVWLGKGEVVTLQKGFEGSTSSPSGMALAFYDAMWAYDGWHSLNYITEELKTPYINLPRANVLGVLLVTVIYVLTNISYLAVLGAEGLLNSSAVALNYIMMMMIRAILTSGQRAKMELWIHSLKVSSIEKSLHADLSTLEKKPWAPKTLLRLGARNNKQSTRPA
uniref:B(0,+)-type amino acid transporter 1 n=1 Tax=Magallana gigas TaxID=29159 RepID=A0A8W8JY48_MAGGI